MGQSCLHPWVDWFYSQGFHGFSGDILPEPADCSDQLGDAHLLSLFPLASWDCSPQLSLRAELCFQLFSREFQWSRKVEP